ncbi:Hypothetical predicted protein, partial [Pelobates cultripes]
RQRGSPLIPQHFSPAVEREGDPAELTIADAPSSRDLKQWSSSLEAEDSALKHDTPTTGPKIAKDDYQAGDYTLALYSPFICPDCQVKLLQLKGTQHETIVSALLDIVLTPTLTELSGFANLASADPRVSCVMGMAPVFLHCY